MVDIGQRSLETLRSIPGRMQSLYNPYMKRGAGAGNILEPTYERMTLNPAGHYDELMSKYRPSEEYKAKQTAMLDALNNTMSAGGVAGTPEHQAEAAMLVKNALGEDMQRFIGNLLGIQSRGLSGEENLYGAGYDATNRYGGSMDSALKSIASLQFQQDRQKAMDESSWWDDLLGAGGAVLGAATNPWGSTSLVGKFLN